MKKFYNKIIFIVFLASFLLIASPAFADPKPLEVEYPVIPLATRPATINTSPGEYFQYVFVFLLVVSGFLALGVLIYSGFIYLTSAGNIARTQDARNRILAALSGIVILFCSWLVLNAINPQFLDVSLEPLAAVIPLPDHGILLCTKQVNIEQTWDYIQRLNKIPLKDRPKKLPPEIKNNLAEINNECENLTASNNVSEWIKGRVKYVYTIPFLEEVKETVNGREVTKEKPTFYGAILFKNSDFKSSFQIIYYVAGAKPSPGFPVQERNQLLSVQIAELSQIANPTDSIKLYEEINYNQGHTVDRVAFSYAPSQNFGQPYDLGGFEGGDLKNPKTGQKLKQIGSMSIEGSLIAIFFQYKTFGGQSWSWNEEEEITVVPRSEENLNLVDPIKNWCEDGWIWVSPPVSAGMGGGRYRQTLYNPCATSIVILNGKII